MSEIKLKPCPFCGGEAEIQDGSGLHYVYCTKCGASTIGRIKGGTEKSVQNWNTRKPMERIVEKLNNRIEKAGRIMVENPADMLDKIANDAEEDFIQAYEEAIEIVQKGGAE